MRPIKKLVTVFVLLLTPLAADAQNASLATSSPGGSVHNLGLMLANVAGEAGIDLRITPFNTTTQAIPVVAGGEVTFGLANAYELQMAESGTVAFDGSPVEGLRAVSALYPFKMSLMVRADSDIETMADLAGRRLPAGFGATATGEFLIGGMLAAAGLSYEEVEQVTVSSFGDMQTAFEADRIDAMIAIVGSGRDVRINETVGGIRVLGIPGDAEAEARMQEFVPVARAEPVAAADGLVGVTEDMFTLTYDYYLYTSAGTSEDIVTAVLQAVIDEQDTIAETIPAFAWFDVENADADIGLEFHPGALTLIGD